MNITNGDAAMRLRPRLLSALAASALAIAITLPVQADEALVAVAANYSAAAQATADLFARHSGHRIMLTTGSTGKLYAQVVAGSPLQAMLSADAATPERLEREGLAVAGTRFTYATGRLALWSADRSRLSADGAATLAGHDFRYLAIANPDLAPYGAAARATLLALGLWEALQPRIVMGQNIGQTFALVRSGNAELGIIALSALHGLRPEDAGSTWPVPGDLHPPIRQDAVLLTAGAGNAAARAFLEFLKGPQARAIAVDHGYGVD